MAFSSATLATIESLIREVELRVKSLAAPIEGEAFDRVGFVDGSYVADERRGVYVLAVSAATVLVDGGRIEGVLRGSSKPRITILAPKSYGEARSSLLMSMLELLGAADLLRRGVRAVFLDGSYISEVMVPFGHPRDAYEDFHPPAGSEGSELLEDSGSEVERKARRLVGSEPLTAFADLLSAVWECAGGLYSAFSRASPDLRGRKEALDFAVVFCESTAYVALLDGFLESCRAAGVYPFWVAKDAESRFIVEREGVVGWLNDLTLLDYAWRELDEVHVELEGQRLHRPKPCAIWEPLLERLYSSWGGNRVSYFKLTKAGAVSQATFPEFVPKSAVESALATLLSLADRRGYPRPLSYVHHIAVLSPDFVRLVADELYRREANPILKSMLAPSGRVAAGLR